MTSCLDENRILELAQGTLTPEEQSAAEAHIDGCDACVALLAALAPALPLQETAAASADTSWVRRLPLASGSTLERYLILEVLGVGGMGVVYLAYDPDLDRKLAIKVLRSAGEDDAAARARLLREAQTMARLAHPNVVPIYDLGTVGDSVFVAMELVHGTTLRRHLEAERRHWREIIRMFIEAGRGLAAAHAAGIVHRDFKPDNVLVGEDGRVLVTDFGLARTGTGPATEAGGDIGPARPLSLRTRTGTLLGTPAFMSPEQMRGGIVDARSDQFSFCVTLLEALCRTHPFASPSWEETQRRASNRELRVDLELTHLPARVRRVVLRGLDPAPEGRFPTMDALLSALERAVRPRWRRPLIASLAAALVAALGLAWLVGSDDASARCRADGAERLRAAWPAVPGAAAPLQRWVDEWTAAYGEICEASGEQSEELFLRRRGCLGRQLAALRATAAALADPSVAAASAEIAGTLPRVERCADAQALRELAAWPRDAATLSTIDEIEADIAFARAQSAAGRVAKAGEAIRRAAARAHELGHAPTLAHALLWLGRLLGASARPQAIASLKAAVWMAHAAADDRSVAEAAAELVRLVPPESEQWAELARAALARGGGSAEIEADLLDHEGEVQSRRGTHREAARLHEEAVRLRAALSGPNLALAASLRRLADALGMLGESGARRTAIERAKQVQKAALRIP